LAKRGSKLNVELSLSKNTIYFIIALVVIVGLLSLAINSRTKDGLIVSKTGYASKNDPEPDPTPSPEPGACGINTVFVGDYDCRLCEQIEVYVKSTGTCVESDGVIRKFAKDKEVKTYTRFSLTGSCFESTTSYICIRDFSQCPIDDSEGYRNCDCISLLPYENDEGCDCTLTGQDAINSDNCGYDMDSIA